jgi:hypothetical protein
MPGIRVPASCGNCCADTTETISRRRAHAPAAAAICPTLAVNQCPFSRSEMNSSSEAADILLEYLADGHTDPRRELRGLTPDLMARGLRKAGASGGNAGHVIHSWGNGGVNAQAGM